MYPRTVNLVNLQTLIPKIIIETTEKNDELFPPEETNRYDQFHYENE